ncbi:hypothetical protein [Celeribacter sp.]|uniref:hypothetical protein n=1 Tax=Celeribacter sp. TaxID=1890673 RepID=UPI003A8D2DCC
MDPHTYAAFRAYHRRQAARFNEVILEVAGTPAPSLRRDLLSSTALLSGRVAPPVMPS